MSERLGMGHTPGRRIGRFFTKEYALPNLSKQIERRMIRRIIPNNMQFVSCAVNGLQGSGKTEYIMYWCWLIEKTYPGLVRTIYANDVNVVLSEIENIPSHIRIVVVVLEDMMSNQASYSTARDEKKAADWFEIRHKVRRKIGDTGIVYGFLIWQRYTSVNANFRNTDMYALLSPMLNETDADVVRRMIGDRGYQAVKQEYADRQIADERRSRVVIHISALDGETAGYHDYKYIRQHDPEWEYPLLLESSTYFAPPDKSPSEKALERLASDPNQSRDARIYARHLEGVGHKSIAKEFKLSRSRVTEIIASVKKKIEVSE